MQEDKNLKTLLQQWAIETPSADFASHVMQRVTLAERLHTTPLHKQKLPRVLLGTFILVCIVLLALSFNLPSAVIASLFTVKLPAQYLYQGFWFLAAFWMIMLLNMFYKQYFFNRSLQNHQSSF